MSKLILSLKDADGLLAIRVSEGPLMSPGGPPAYSKVLQTSWETLEDMMTWTQTPGAQDGDKEFMLESGAILLFYEVKDIE